MIKKLLLLIITTYSFACHVEINATISPKAGTITATITNDTNTTYMERKLPKEISPHFISLLGDWYPSKDRYCRHDLYLTLPKSFDAISESETIRVEEKGEKKHYHFSLPRPTKGFSIIASDDYVIEERRYKDITLATYFFSKDRALSQAYLEKAKAYIAHYEKQIGPFPYKRFHIVENQFQTGYSMPTFTLIGSRIIDKPFLLERSLGHEILHQWFGNGIFNDFSQGNWVEGLTTYLADHAYQAEQSFLYRKDILHNYALYVDSNHSIPLSHFTSRSDKATQAIGYGKGAFAFHMLRESIGKQKFDTILKAFYQHYLFKEAHYQDIADFFSKESGKELDSLFHFLFKEQQVLDLQLSTPTLSYHDSSYQLDFNLSLGITQPKLTLPLTIMIDNKRQHLTIENNNTISLRLKKRPYLLTIDPDYDLFRKLTTKEELLTLSRAFHDRAPSLWLKEATFNPKVEGFSIQIVKDLSTKKGYRLKLESRDKAQLTYMAQRLAHYGAYQSLHFIDAKLIKKQKPTSQDGIQIALGKQDIVLKVPKANTIEAILKDLERQNLLFVGEYHDNFAHHINQLEIIKQLKRCGKSVAIGMEMFQRPFQSILDSYIAGKISEKAFLQKSEYFSRWGYDYQLYKPLLDYAKREHIPIIALNLDRNITKKISKGGLASLSKEERATLPHSLDFSNEAYRAKLFSIFEDPEHFASLPPSHRPNLSYLYQSQILWDETMAESIANYLKAHPKAIMIVIVGNGHIENYVGIPERVQRRIKVDARVILQDYPIKAGSADYILSPSKIAYTKSPKLGVFLEADKLHVTKLVPNSLATQYGIEKGDTILKLSEMKVKNLADLKLALYLYGDSKDLEIEILRKGKTMILRRKK